MRRKFQCKAIPSTWLENNGRRLDCGPYMSGAIEAIELLKNHLTEPLRNLTAGHNGGIFNGPRFPRIYVRDPACGKPFLGSTDILQGDLTNMHLLSNKQVAANQALLIDEGWTLITCSGTIGRMSYARPAMKGMAGSQHFMRVAPDAKKIKPGYLYAYLSSRFGIPIVISGTYGAIIQHIEPHHLEDLPVPRLGKIEDQAHGLIEQAATLLGVYQSNINRATRHFFEVVGLRDITINEWHSWGTDIGFTATFDGPTSLRALNYNPRYQRIINKIKSVSWKPLADLCNPDSIKRGGRFLRVDGEPEFSYMMVGQKQIFWLRPEGRWIGKKFLSEDLIGKPGTTLIAAVGTLEDSEKYCRSEFIWGKGAERAYSEHFYQVLPIDDVMPSGCLFAFMRSETAFRMLRSISYGTKLQVQRPDYLRDMPIPYPESKEERESIHKLIIEAYESRDRAIELEDEARTLVERTIEQGGC